MDEARVTTKGPGAVDLKHLTVDGRPARIFCGGTGSPVVLLHGGWAGAEFHWNRVWQKLSRRHFVIAPDLPGLGAVEHAPLASVGEYARWLSLLLKQLGVERAWLVGNSFGASVAWSLAGRFPEQCAGLVLVNGVAMHKTPPVLARGLESAAVHRVMEWLAHRLIYTPRTVLRAFKDPAKVPPQLERIMERDWQQMVPRFVDVIIAGDGAPKPKVRPVLVWGVADRLPGTRLKDLERLRKSLPGSRLSAIAGAGHFPQLEAPEEFVAALEAILSE